jgi:hypothetical protein
MPGNCEISLSNNGWGGDLATDETGDLVLAIDTPNNPIATQQRIYRLLMTSPRQSDQDLDEWCSIPDDLFAPTYGAGLRFQVGQMMTAGLIGQLESAIFAALQTDPTIVSLPPPSVTITNAGSNTLQIDISATAVSGEIITIPSFTLPLGSPI